MRVQVLCWGPMPIFALGRRAEVSQPGSEAVGRDAGGKGRQGADEGRANSMIATKRR